MERSRSDAAFLAAPGEQHEPETVTVGGRDWPTAAKGCDLLLVNDVSGGPPCSVLFPLVGGALTCACSPATAVGPLVTVGPGWGG